MARKELTDRGRERRDGLLKHALELIGERGITRTTVRDVARAANVPSSLFYWYFDDLDDLVRFAIREATRRFRRRIAASVEGLEDPRERLYVALREAVRIGSEDPASRVLTAAEAELQLGGLYRDELDRAIDVFIADARGLLEEGRRSGAIRKDVPALHLAYCLRSLVHYNLTAYFRGLVGGDVQSLAATIASVGLRGICSDPAAADEIVARLERARRLGSTERRMPGAA